LLAAVWKPRGKASWKSSLSARSAGCSTHPLCRTLYDSGKSWAPAGSRLCRSSHSVSSCQVCHHKEVFKSQISFLLFLRISLNFIYLFFIIFSFTMTNTCFSTKMYGLTVVV